LPVREQGQMARALDGLDDLALLARGVARDAARQDLARLRQEHAEHARVLVVDDEALVGREARDLGAAEGLLAQLARLLARLGAQGGLRAARVGPVALAIAVEGRAAARMGGAAARGADAVRRAVGSATVDVGRSLGMIREGGDGIGRPPGL